MNNIKKSLEQFCKIFKSKNKKLIISVIKELIIFIFILCFLKIPFILCRDIVVDYFNKISYGSYLGIQFYMLFELLYFFFVLLMIKNWLTKRFSTNDK